MLVIRDMEEKDYERKGYIHYQTWIETYVGLMDQEYLDKHTLDRCIQIAKKYPENTIVAEYNHEIVGFAAYNKSSDNEDNIGEVYAIYVLKNFQKLGIGKALMDECICRLNNYEYIAIWVLFSNVKSIAWYIKYGFEEDGKTKKVKVLENYSLNENRLIYDIKKKTDRNAKD
ncbi:MAG: GNAT family N-acetyltransferase [Acholeplasmataceae bacterium]|nr:GNAT family N-acetyltransferase [Acholeplasmataceae bacterium]